MTGFNPHQNRTIDGVLVTEGLAVWDYNLRQSVVIADKDGGKENYCPAYCNDDHWFDTTGGMFNASRMWVRHPKTGKVATV